MSVLLPPVETPSPLRRTALRVHLESIENSAPVLGGICTSKAEAIAAKARKNRRREDLINRGWEAIFILKIFPGNGQIQTFCGYVYLLIVVPMRN